MTDQSTAVVIGAGGAVGGAVSERLLADGWRVHGVDVEPATNPDVTWHAVDATDLSRLVEVAGDVGPVDLLVTAQAQWPLRAEAHEITDDDWASVAGVFLNASFMSCRAFFANLLAASGTVVNIASVTAHQAFVGHAHYCAANAGIAAMSEVLALEWGPQGIRVFTVSPGPLRTPILDEIWGEDPDREAAALAGVPQHRLAGPAEFAEVVVALARAPFTHIAGTAVIVDGGATAAGGY